jgi:DNA-binding MarR family transcriptional regulator
MVMFIIMKKNKIFPDLTPCHCMNTRWVSREVSRFYQNLIGQCGLNSTQYALLGSLRRYGPLTMNELSQVSRLERTTLVRKLKPLQTEGFICMYTSDASKANLVAITDKGRKILEQVDPCWDKAQESFRAQFDDGEWGYFMKILRKLSKINDQGPQ